MRKYVKIPGWPPDHARKAFDDEYFLEALQTIHGWVECKLRELLLLQRTQLGASHETWSRAWDLVNETSLIQAARALFILGAITEQELSRITEFNKIRNNIIHKLFWDPYDDRWKGVPMVEVEKAFKSGIKLCDEVENKSADLLASTPPSNKPLKRGPCKKRVAS